MTAHIDSKTRGDEVGGSGRLFGRHRGHARFSPFLIATTLVLALLAAQDADAKKRGVERAKIDHVDTSEAPEVRIFVTYLKGNGFPVNPKKLESVTVYIDDLASNEEVETTTFMKLGWGIDLVFVLSMHGIARPQTVEAVAQAADTQIGLAKEIDKIGIVIDNGKVLESGPLGPPGGATDVLGKVDPKDRGGGAYTYDAIEKGLSLFEGEPDENRKRIMLVITDGADQSTWGGDRLAIEGFLQRTVKGAKEKRVQIFAVLYRPYDELEAQVIRLVTRKSGGTFREASTSRAVLREIKKTYGEIYGQLVFTIDGEFSENMEYKFVVEMKREKSKRKMKTMKFVQEVKEIKTDWVTIAIVAAAILFPLLIILLVIVIVLIWKKIKKKKDEEKKKLEEAKKAMGLSKDEDEEEDEEEALGLGAGGGEAEDNRPRCPRCNRVQMEGWTECMFCQRGLPLPDEVPDTDIATALGPAAAAFAAGAAAMAAKDALDDDEEQETTECEDCGREHPADWAECLYCAAGMGPEDEKKADKAADEDEEEEEEELPECPDCGMPMQPHWPECINCAASRK